MRARWIDAARSTAAEMTGQRIRSQRAVRRAPSFYVRGRQESSVDNLENDLNKAEQALEGV